MPVFRTNFLKTSDLTFVFHRLLMGLGSQAEQIDVVEVTRLLLMVLMDLEVTLHMAPMVLTALVIGFCTNRSSREIYPAA